MNFETGNMLFLLGCVTVLLLVGGPEFTEARFEFGAYCRKLCAWGKGGNLCKCNAVHFAGKRVEADDLRQEQEMLGDGGDTYDPDLPEFMDKDEDEEPKHSSLDSIRKIYHQMETMNRMHGPSKTSQMILDTLQKMLASGNRKSAATDRS